ncbi:MAG TPA: Nif3-like dinuclear metal center hexameric protein [Anaerolineae bacterium]|nr:Nif3-like dinuclear metal center hexameric protein [Anaerolineae bacterium]
MNVTYQQRLIEMSCDVLTAGESDNYGFRFSAELGIPMIETGHEISENPGLEHFARMLQDRFPELVVSFCECEPAWRMAWATTGS